jgi:hypothetical protein
MGRKVQRRIWPCISHQTAAARLVGPRARTAGCRGAAPRVRAPPTRSETLAAKQQQQQQQQLQPWRRPPSRYPTPRRASACARGAGSSCGGARRSWTRAPPLACARALACPHPRPLLLGSRGSLQGTPPRVRRSWWVAACTGQGVGCGGKRRGEKLVVVGSCGQSRAQRARARALVAADRRPIKHARTHARTHTCKWNVPSSRSSHPSSSRPRPLGRRVCSVRGVARPPREDVRDTGGAAVGVRGVPCRDEAAPDECARECEACESPELAPVAGAAAAAAIDAAGASAAVLPEANACWLPPPPPDECSADSADGRVVVVIRRQAGGKPPPPQCPPTRRPAAPPPLPLAPNPPCGANGLSGSPIAAASKTGVASPWCGLRGSGAPSQPGGAADRNRPLLPLPPSTSSPLSLLLQLLLLLPYTREQLAQDASLPPPPPPPLPPLPASSSLRTTTTLPHALPALEGLSPPPCPPSPSLSRPPPPPPP